MPIRMRRRGPAGGGEFDAIISSSADNGEDATLLPMISYEGSDDDESNKEEIRCLSTRWLTSQWRQGDLRDKAFLLLLIVLCLTLIFGGIAYYFFFVGFARSSSNISIGDRPILPSSITTTIHIPMEDIPEGEGPTLTLFRPFLESSFWSPSRKHLRQTGQQALVQLGDQLRQLMELGSDLFEPPSSAQTQIHINKNNTAKNHLDDEKNKIQRFQKLIKEMAPWLKGDPNHHQSQGLEEGKDAKASTSIWPINEVPSPYNNYNTNLPGEGDKNKGSTNHNNDKAVVICAGDKQLEYLHSMLHNIRNIHHSTIPIRIVYRGDDDLSPQSREQLTQKFATSTTGTTNSNFGDDDDGDYSLRFIDLTKLFDLNNDDDPQLKSLKGWNLKPFGMLAVPESQVILLDVDVLLLRPPDDFFDFKGYKTTGALFFRDRSGGEHLWTPRQFVVSMMQSKIILNNNNNNQAYKALTNGNIWNEHIQEAGVVMIDKSRRWKGLWTICLILGRWDIRRYLQRDIIYGDKEVYFTAFETIQEPYAFARYYPGVLGSVVSDFHGDELEWKVDTLPPESVGRQNSDNDINPKKKNLDIYELGPFMALCGRMLHFDDEGLPLWSNGGYLTREDDRNAKNSMASNGLKPLLFIDGGDSTVEEGPNGKEGNQNWRFHHGLGVLCLFPNKRNVQKVPSQYAEEGRKAVDYYIKTSNTGNQGDH